METKSDSTDHPRYTAGTKLIEFPMGVPKPHKMAAYGRSLEQVTVELNLSDVSRNQLPAGRFAAPFSDASVADLPELPDDPTPRDKLGHIKAMADLEVRRAHNRKVDDEIRTYWRDMSHLYFLLITGSMERTNPAMRERLRDLYHVGGGYYDGVGAMEYVTEWVRKMHARNPSYDLYERLSTLILQKRLQIGCRESDFLAVTRKYIYGITNFILSYL